MASHNRGSFRDNSRECSPGNSPQHTALKSVPCPAWRCTARQGWGFKLSHIVLHFSMVDLRFFFIFSSPGTKHIIFSTVLTGPPQQGKRHFTCPGAALLISSSTFFFASSAISLALSCIACILGAVCVAQRLVQETA